MRELMINRIDALIVRLPGENIFRTSRWLPIGNILYSLTGNDPETKAGRKAVAASILEDYKLNELTDEQLLKLFELVVQRYFMQM